MMTNAPKSTRTDSLEALRAQIHALKEQATKLEEKLEARARGTGDVTEKAIQAAALAALVDPDHRPFFIGDETSTEILMATIIRAIEARPRTLLELVEITGARRNRISGALVKIQVQQPGRVKNQGNNYRALWYMPRATPAKK